jgi:hypothetical protein
MFNFVFMVAISFAFMLTLNVANAPCFVWYVVGAIFGALYMEI